MYTIEYYKTKRKKPENKEPKDIIEKCWNIKSLTINLEDIWHIAQDDNRGRQLLGLCARVRRLKFNHALGDDIDSITILNNNILNLQLIYEIINCKWLVNADGEIDSLEVLRMGRRLLTLLEQYDKETEQQARRRIKDEIDLIKYYMDTILNKKDSEKTEPKALKLGTGFIWKRGSHQ